jgi:hypothetical protein
MTPQIKLVLFGVAAFAASKYYFKRDTGQSLLAGLAAISAVAVLTAHTDKDK